MRIIVVSDTHGDMGRLRKVVARHRDADCFIHLGDGRAEMLSLMKANPDIKYYSVCGNCDFASQGPAWGEAEFGGKKFFFTHGHRYYVKGGGTRIIEEARRRGADVLLYGHTHRAVCEYDGGLYIINPGSLGMPDDGRPTYAVADVTPAGIAAHIAEL
jgi:putative phosphoesterase